MDVAPWDKHWIEIELDGIQCFSMVFVGIQWDSLGFIGIRRDLVVFNGI